MNPAIDEPCNRRHVLRISSRLATMGGAVRQGIATYRTALTDRNVALLVGAGRISEIGDWFHMVALITRACR